MSSILYYSNFCEHSKKLLQGLSKTQLSKDIHFICIDKRVKDNDKIYIILENQQKIIMPENVTKVPALLLLTQNYKVIYGEEIYQFMKPKQEIHTKQATSNNMEPMAFSLGGGGFCGGVASDNYSFLDMDSEELNTKGNGGMRQMHNYVSLNYQDAITTPTDDNDYKQPKISSDMTIEKLQQQREQEISAMNQSQQRR
jgi:hypothetical protein